MDADGSADVVDRFIQLEPEGAEQWRPLVEHIFHGFADRVACPPASPVHLSEKEWL
jgi:hypothetical protein